MYRLPVVKMRSTLAHITLVTIWIALLCPHAVSQDVKNPIKNKKYTIVLDAGHGGKDSGCLGAYSMEKDIALDLTLAIGQALQHRYDIEVVYTREADYFIPLHERSQIANEHQADLFVSVHCNAASDRRIRGSETFVMGLHTSAENLEVAKRENRSIHLEDNQEAYGDYDPDSPLGHIILARTQQDHLEQSLELASEIETALSQVAYKSRGVKQAGFVVLRATAMPSVLIEAGFLSNQADEDLLNDKLSQERMAGLIAQSISAMLPPAPIMLRERQDHRRAAVDPIAALPVSSVEMVVRKPTYSIQIGAFTMCPTAEQQQAWEIYPHLQVTKDQGLYKVSVGNFLELESAVQYQNHLRRSGHRDAFVVAR